MIGLIFPCYYRLQILQSGQGIQSPPAASLRGSLAPLVCQHLLWNQSLGKVGNADECGWLRYDLTAREFSVEKVLTSAGSVSKTSVNTAPFSCPMLLAAQTFYTRKKKARVSTDAGIFQIEATWSSHGDPKIGIPVHTPSGFIAHLCQKRCYLGTDRN